MLVDHEIKDLIEDQNIYADEEIKAQPVSVDLHIEKVIFWSLDEKVRKKMEKEPDCNLDDSDILLTYQTPYSLQPHETVFVKTGESLELPPNIVARIVEKNTTLRMGLQVSGPMYQPGHKTGIFLRVSNLTDYVIKLTKNFSIAQIIFKKISTPTTSYAQKEDGKYNNESTFTVPIGNLKLSVKPEENVDEGLKISETKTKMIASFAVFLEAFISILAVIFLNINFFEKHTAVLEVVKINFSLAVCIAVILGTVFHLYLKMNNDIKKKVKKHKSKFMKKKKYPRLFRKDSQQFIYIASRYIAHNRNIELRKYLEENQIQVVLPEDMGLTESPKMEAQKLIFHSCYNQIDRCAALIAVYPFGKSVSAEIGYAIAKNKTLIALKPDYIKDHPECMITPGFDFTVSSKEELIILLKKLYG